MKKSLLTLIAILIAFVSNAQVGENDFTYSIGTGFNDMVLTSALQSDGKLIVAGRFTAFNGVTRNRIARLNIDGTLDLTFDPLDGFTSDVTSIAIQSDGRIVAGGYFTTYNGTARIYIVRINTSGSIDATFNSVGTGLNNGITSLVIQPSDGKIVIGGYFTSYNGTSRNRIVRLNTDGTLDVSFDPGTGFDNYPETVALNSTEKIAVAGRFSAFNGVARYGVALLNTTGALDASFNPNAFMGGPINCLALAVQSDDKMLISTIPYGSSVYRFNTNGTQDISFAAGGAFGDVVMTLNIQPDGKILAGGLFNKGLRRLTTTGSNDGFVIGNGFGATPEVRTTAIQADGKVIVGGGFTYYDYTNNRKNIARLGPCPTVSITTQPTNTTKCETENASFNVITSGSGLSYQWQVDPNTGVFSDLSNGGIYAGVTTSTLSLTGVSLGLNSYKYRCIISDISCQSTSYTAYLYVNASQSISSHPIDKTICENTSTTINASVSGAPGGYQWQEDQGSGFVNLTNGGIYSGVTTTVLGLTSVPLTMNGYKYRLVASACIPVTSNFAVLTVVAPPLITTQPSASTSYCTPNTVPININFIVTGSGLTYQWQYYAGGSTWVNIVDGAVASGLYNAGGVYSGALTNAIMITSPTANTSTSSCLYRCIISNGTCTVITNISAVAFYSTPIVATHPADVTKCANSSGVVTFGITLGAVPSGITYQWQEDAGSGFVNIINGGIYSGATTQTLTLASGGITASMNNNKYRCAVGVCSPTVVSFEGNLYVDEMPIIITAPQPVTICDGMDAGFGIDATGSSLSYQWKEQVVCCTYNNLTNGGIYSGVNSDSLVISPANFGMNLYRYLCVVSSGTCSVTSSNTTLFVRQTPTFNTHPLNKIICEGSNTSMSTSANFAYGAYQWQVDQFGLGIFVNLIDNAIYSGTNSSVMTITGATVSMNGYIYRCVAGSCFPEVSSNSATLTVNALPIISSHPVNQLICQGNNILFFISTIGSTYTYQWQCDFGSASWGNISSSSVYLGTTTDTLQITNPPLSYDNYSYRCIVSNGVSCSTVSNAGLLNITGLLAGLNQAFPTTIDPSVTFSINYMPPSATTWYWNFGDGDTLTGNTNPTHVYTVNGVYSACLIGLNDCDSLAHCYNVSISTVGIEELAMLNNITIQPNPAVDRVVIANIQKEVELTIYNSLGQMVYYTSISHSQFIIDFIEFDNGMYYFELKDKNQKLAERRIKLIKTN